jgi:hypothetical protein
VAIRTLCLLRASGSRTSWHRRSLDMLREMIKGFAQAMMDAEVEQPLWARRG